jgi:hypothetical protein
MEVHQAERPSVDLLLLLDSSSSMEEKVPGDTRRKGDLVTDAMISFVKDPASAGLGGGLQLFPGTGRSSRPPARPSACLSDTECGPNTVCRSARECLSKGLPPVASVLGTSLRVFFVRTTGCAWTPLAARSRTPLVIRRVSSARVGCGAMCASPHLGSACPPPAG